MRTTTQPYRGLPGFALDDTPAAPNKPTPDRSLLENFELLTDLARYGEGLLERAQVKKKWRKLISDEMWEALATDDELVDAIEAEKIRRIRDGSAKRERAQQHVVAAPDILNGIMSDPKQSAKHRIDSAKVLDQFAGDTPDAAVEKERFTITINLSADTKDPKDILVFEATPNPNNTTIDHAPQTQRLIQQEPTPPVRRGPGRPPGSKNKPKSITESDDDE
jgi:hypothetical protein